MLDDENGARRVPQEKGFVGRDGDGAFKRLISRSVVKILNGKHLKI